jgi:hypothetical protein
MKISMPTPAPEELRLTRVENNTNGNPRYVAHFLHLNTREELDANPWIDTSKKYALALNRARSIGGRKYHNRSYGGGVIFVSYCTQELAEHVSRVTGRSFVAVVE